MLRKKKVWVLPLKVGTVGSITMKNKCIEPNLGYIQQTVFAIKPLNVLMVKHMWEDGFPCCFEEEMKARSVKSTERSFYLNRGDLNKRSQLPHVLGIFYPQVVFSLFVQFDECFVVLSTTSVIALGIHNPRDFVGKAARCGTAVVSAENQWNCLRTCSKNNSFFLDEEICFEDVLSVAICFETGEFLYSSKIFARWFLS